MDTQKVVFMNKELGLRLAGLLRIPEGFDLSKNYPAIVITGPMLSVKEQAQSVYAERLTKAGYVTLVFDGAFFGESEGMPRGQELPNVKESDIEGAVDYPGHLRIRFLYVRGRRQRTQAECHHSHRSGHFQYRHLSDDGFL